MGRSEKILYRVRRGLNQYWPETVQDFEIYDIMQQGQLDIVTESRTLVKLITIDTVVDQESYVLQSNSENIGSIKEIIWPEDWTTDLVEVNFINWNETKRINVLAPDGQPRYYAFNDKKIYFHPIPSTVETVNIWTYLDFTGTEIGAGVEPEVPKYWDKALYYYTMSDFSTGQDKIAFLQLYQAELNEKKTLAFKTTLNIQPKTKETSW